MRKKRTHKTRPKIPRIAQGEALPFCSFLASQSRHSLSKKTSFFLFLFSPPFRHTKSQPFLLCLFSSEDFVSFSFLQSRINPPFANPFLFFCMAIYSQPWVHEWRSMASSMEERLTWCNSRLVCRKQHAGRLRKELEQVGRPGKAWGC